MRKPAEAEKYRLEKIAEAERMRIVLEAEALAEAKQLKVLKLNYNFTQNSTLYF